MLEKLGSGELRLIIAVARNWRRLLLAGLIGGMVTVVLVMLVSRDWRSVATFVPESGSGSSVANIAVELGLSSGSAAGESPDFYVELLGSEDVLRAIAHRPLKVGGSTFVFADAVGIPMGDSIHRDFRALQELKRRLKVTAGRRTGVVRVEIVAPSPTIAQQLTQAAVDAVNDFNGHIRRRRASAERTFTDQRLELSKLELRQWEDSLRSFLNRNREFRQSATLSLEYDRLSQEILTRRTLVTALTSSFEQSRIDEVRNTPVISVVQTPSYPAVPVARNTIIKGIAGSVFFACLALLRFYWLVSVGAGRIADDELLKVARVSLRRGTAA